MNKNKSPDQSPYVSQGEKFKGKLQFKDKIKWTDKQKKFIELALDKNTKIVICRGSPGTGKTMLATYCSLMLLSEKKVSDIIFYRNPIESCSKGLGFLKGEYSDKIAPYGEPLHDHLKEFLDKPTINTLLNERISVESIGFAKGRTHNACAIICEESEDLNLQELELIMGRMGNFSKLFIIGDERQANVRNSGFTKVFNLFSGPDSQEQGIVTFEFTKEDCMRSPVLRFIIGKFESLAPNKA